jgi:5-methylcytosine-specific restriction endonuclease McrA
MKRDYYAKYPRRRCWRRVKRIIRRRASGKCQYCGRPCDSLEVHHIGAPFANGRPGDPRDKHDIRLENLAAICFECHDRLENVAAIRWKRREQRRRRREALTRHRALGIGTGLVVWQGDQGATWKGARPC